MDDLHLSEEWKDERRNESYSESAQRGSVGETSLLWDNLHGDGKTQETVLRAGSMWHSSGLVNNPQEEIAKPHSYEHVDLLSLRDIDFIQLDPVGSVGFERGMSSQQATDWRGQEKMTLDGRWAREGKEMEGEEELEENVCLLLPNSVNKSILERNLFLLSVKLNSLSNTGMHEQPSHLRRC